MDRFLARTLRDMTGEVVDWIDPLLPNRNPFDTAIKMQEELSELLHALHSGEGDVGGELADMFILLLDCAHLNYINLQLAFEKKMEINRRRLWKPSMGTMKHEKEDK